jgi:hypothetical protein
MTTPELTALAAEIEAAGKADGVTASLLKGVADGLNGLIGLLGQVVPLVKAQPAPAATPAPAADPNPAAPAGGGGDADPDPAPGYQDMMFGRSPDPGAPLAPPQDAAGNINVTRFLWATGQAIQNLEKGSKAERGMILEMLNLVKAQQGRIDMLEALVRGSIEGQVRIAAPLSKAVADLTIAVHDIPAPATTFRRPTPPKPAPASGGDGAFLGGTPEREKQLLAKALGRGIITSGMRRMFHLDRNFVEDPTENAEVRTKILALAS